MLHAGDANHSRAARVFRRLVESKESLVTSSYVLVETTTLLQHRFGLGAVRIFQDDVVPVLGSHEWTPSFMPRAQARSSPRTAAISASWTA